MEAFFVLESADEDECVHEVSNANTKVGIWLKILPLSMIPNFFNTFTENKDVFVRFILTYGFISADLKKLLHYGRNDKLGFAIWVLTFVNV